jgi:NADPH:quinone reductase-like Zn-dependent oxidoreductase
LIAGLAVEGVLRPSIEVIPLEDIASAHAKIESAHTRGKLVLTISTGSITT